MKKIIIPCMSTLLLSIPLITTATLNQHTTIATQAHYPQLTTSLKQTLSHTFRQEGFQGSVLVRVKDKTVFQRAYGYADKDAGKHNASTSISDMGSIAKTFTAAAVLQLVSQGKLSLSTPLAEIFEKVPENKRTIAVQNLLAHDSGLENFHNTTDFDQMSKSKALNKILNLPMLGKTGEKVGYSNAAYTLLAMIVERISQQDFQQYVRQHILTPYGLHSTGFYNDASIPTTQLAKGYGGLDSGQTTSEKGLTWALIGQGGMVTSMEDLQQWFEILLSGSLFPKGQGNLMLQKANNKYLLGNIRHFHSWGAPSYYAGGSTDYGYTALAQYLPQQDAMIILLLNGYSAKNGNTSHQKLAKQHIFPLLLKHIKLNT